MVSAGLDTVPGNLIMGIAYLASEDGQRIQKKAYDAIMEVYPDGDAWEKCLVEEKVPYVTALVKEILRFWTVIPICLPRESTKDIQWNGATIPAGTTFFMVCMLFIHSIFILLTLFRMPGLLITTRITLKMRINSSLSVTWGLMRALELLTMATGRVLACARALILQTGSFSQRSSA
jgi:hypothetical protein